MFLPMNKMTSLKSYRGNKGFPKAYQEIINLIPPHKYYYELFAGSAGIYNNIKRAELSILNDIDLGVVNKLKKAVPAATTKIYNKNTLQLLKAVRPCDTDTFIYLDPPYPLSSRRSDKDIYNYEMSDFDHVQLLKTLLQKNLSGVQIMISTYKNEIYKKYLEDLGGWNKHTFKTSIHGNLAIEVLYYNYPKPTELHDYSYLGTDCWDRQRINRKIKRNINKIKSLPALEKGKLLEAIKKEFFTTAAGTDKKNFMDQGKIKTTVGS